MNKVLITGSAGFIGGILQRDLMKSGIEVIGVDNFSSYYSPDMKNLRVEELGLRGRVLNIDITEKNSVHRIFHEFQPTHVVHLAAQGGVRASRNNPKPYILSNQLGFLNLLEVSEIFNVKKFIFASSSSVYGDNHSAIFEERETLSAPKSLYALSKYSNELVSQHLPLNNSERIGLRFFTVYGPWGRPDMAMYRLLTSSKLGIPFDLTARRDTQRDFTYVSDVSRVIMELIEADKKFNQPLILNVAGGHPYSLNELFTILDELNIPIKINQKDSDPLDVKKTHGSTKLLSELGFSVPSTPLRDGIEETWNWISAQSGRDLRSWFEYQQ